MDKPPRDHLSEPNIRLIAKVRCESESDAEDLARRFTSRGIVAKASTTGGHYGRERFSVIVNLPLAPEESKLGHGVARIPRELKRNEKLKPEVEFLVNVDEEGGSWGLNLEENISHVVCGESGEILSPVYVQKDRLPCGPSATFCFSCGTIVSSSQKGVHMIRKVRVGHNEDFAWYTIEKISPWDRKFFGEVITFQDALEAAFDKANCVECKHTHFIVPRKQEPEAILPTAAPA